MCFTKNLPLSFFFLKKKGRKNTFSSMCIGNSTQNQNFILNGKRLDFPLLRFSYQVMKEKEYEKLLKLLQEIGVLICPSQIVNESSTKTSIPLKLYSNMSEISKLFINLNCFPKKHFIGINENLKIKLNSERDTLEMWLKKKSRRKEGKTRSLLVCDSNSYLLRKAIYFTVKSFKD